MNRRAFVCGLLATLAGLAGPALAQDPVATIVSQLEARGYTRIAVSKTWLGRIRILAEGPQGTREIILNPATGEILRDLTVAAGRGGGDAEILGSDQGGDQGTGGSGDDDDDDDGDDGDDDDDAPDRDDDDDRDDGRDGGDGDDD